ncbi:MAG: GNAT family N-acetyltransferase [Bacteroidetes bacterium]|nr:GNAT family N-acetyltransferase [Bacteroidota bacterium]
MSTAIRIVPISEDRLQDLQKLYHLTFGKRYSVNYIRLKYDTAYTGMQHVANIAYDGNKPVAFLGAVPMPFLLNNTKLIGVQYCDYMTLPEYRRRGIHSQLLESTTDFVSKEGADFIFAMHTINSANGDLRFNWNFQEPLNAYVISLQAPRIFQLANRMQHYAAVFKKTGATQNNLRVTGQNLTY